VFLFVLNHTKMFTAELLLPGVHCRTCRATFPVVVAILAADHYIPTTVTSEHSPMSAPTANIVVPVD
jgi:hypothetical protein